MRFKHIRFRLEQPKPSPKMDQIFGAMEKGWPNSKINDDVFDCHVLWGLVGNNANIISSGQPYFFCDMPYNGRLDTSKTLTQKDYDQSFWRFCKGGFHDNRKLQVPSDRFESWGVDVKPYQNGEHILICPSSETMTRFIHGISVSEWVARVIDLVSQNTDRQIIIREKPRANRLSGPAAAQRTIEADLAKAHACVVSASLSAVDALKAGVPVFATSEYSPSAWCTNYDFSIVEYPKLIDREHLFYNLAYKQFSIEEFRNGTAFELWETHLQ